jgi:hypothetical protein
MADSLYVCHFSNGTVKVGRSKRASVRVRQHEDRVGVLGVSLLTWKQFPCEGNVTSAERWLIRACELAAGNVRGNEWFEGLAFAQACCLAEEASRIPEDGDEWSDEISNGPRPNFQAVIRALNASGYRQTDLARLCGVGQSSISDIATGRTTDPSYSIGFTLMGLLADDRSMSLAAAVNGSFVQAEAA